MNLWTVSRLVLPVLVSLWFCFPCPPPTTLPPPWFHDLCPVFFPPPPFSVLRLVIVGLWSRACLHLFFFKLLRLEMDICQRWDMRQRDSDGIEWDERQELWISMEGRCWKRALRREPKGPYEHVSYFMPSPQRDTAENARYWRAHLPTLFYPLFISGFLLSLNPRSLPYLRSLICGLVYTRMSTC